MSKQVWFLTRKRIGNGWGYHLPGFFPTEEAAIEASVSTDHASNEEIIVDSMYLRKTGIPFSIGQRCVQRKKRRAA